MSRLRLLPTFLISISFVFLTCHGTPRKRSLEQYGKAHYSLAAIHEKRKFKRHAQQISSFEAKHDPKKFRAANTFEALSNKEKARALTNEALSYKEKTRAANTFEALSNKEKARALTNEALSYKEKTRAANTFEALSNKEKARALTNEALSYKEKTRAANTFEALSNKEKARALTNEALSYKEKPFVKQVSSYEAQHDPTKFTAQGPPQYNSFEDNGKQHSSYEAQHDPIKFGGSGPFKQHHTPYNNPNKQMSSYEAKHNPTKFYAGKPKTLSLAPTEGPILPSKLKYIDYDDDEPEGCPGCATKVDDITQPIFATLAGQALHQLYLQSHDKFTFDEVTDVEKTFFNNFGNTYSIMFTAVLTQCALHELRSCPRFECDTSVFYSDKNGSTDIECVQCNPREEPGPWRG